MNKELPPYNEAKREFEKVCDEHVKRNGRNAKVYISGPMTDPKTGRVTDENIMAFVRAYALLKKEKYQKIVSPTRVWVCKWPWMYRLLEKIFGKTVAYKLVLLYDIILLMRCDMIYKIPGWKESRGAQIESCIAYHFNLWVLPTKQREKIDRKLAKAMETWKNKRITKTE